jgi:redox-sensitive bicupin YhaK (pirin superfamily)
MSAGTGIRHSEFNHSKTDPVHFLQIWVVPDRQGIAPRYQQKTFPDAEKRGRLRLVGSSDGSDGSVVIHQDVELLASLLTAGERVTRALAAGRKGWIQVIRGAVALHGDDMAAGDGAAVANEPDLSITAKVDNTELLVSICRRDNPPDAPA